MSVTWFGFGEASSHDGPRIEGRPGSEGGRGGEREVREARSDPRAGLLGREVTITQKCVCENLQVQAGHRTPQLLHIICVDRHHQNHTDQPDLCRQCKSLTSTFSFVVAQAVLKTLWRLWRCWNRLFFICNVFFKNWQNNCPLFHKKSLMLLWRQDKPVYVFCVCLYDMLVLVKRKQLC